MIASFHNHTVWSDGRNTVAELCVAAEKQAIEILGISDHFCLQPDLTSPKWSLSSNRLKEYLAEIGTHRQTARIDLIAGLECDWFPNHAGVLAPILADLRIDFRIGSVHHVDGFLFDGDPSFWASKSVAERDEVFVKYWRLITEMAESRLFDIAAHLDLPKKFGFRPSQSMTAFIASALDAIKANGLTVELNTAGFGKPCAEGYPSSEILAMCRVREIPVTLSADAHITEHLTYEFARGLRLLRQVGFKELARFKDRIAWFEPLDSAFPT